MCRTSRWGGKRAFASDAVGDRNAPNSGSSPKARRTSQIDPKRKFGRTHGPRIPHCPVQGENRGLLRNHVRREKSARRRLIYEKGASEPTPAVMEGDRTRPKLVTGILGPYSYAPQKTKQVHAPFPRFFCQPAVDIVRNACSDQRSKDQLLFSRHQLL
jgi:hypothetical protein